MTSGESINERKPKHKIDALAWVPGITGIILVLGVLPLMILGIISPTLGVGIILSISGGLQILNSTL